MLQLGATMRVVEGVTVFSDHADPDLFWYLPAPVDLADKPDGSKAFSFIKYKDGARSGGARGGGFLMFETSLKVDETTQRAIRAALRSQSRDPQLQMVPFDEGTVECVALNLQGGGGTSAAPAPPGTFNAVEDILGTSVPSLFGDNRALFSLTLSQEGATILEQALAQQAAPIGVIYKLKFTALRPSLHVRITADLKRVYDEFSAGLSASIKWVSVSLEAAFQKLQQDGVIQIKVLSFTDDADVKEQEKWALNFFRDNLLADWFQPSLSPRDIPAAGSLAPSLPAGSSSGGVPVPTGSSQGGGSQAGGSTRSGGPLSSGGSGLPGVPGGPGGLGVPGGPGGSGVPGGPGPQPAGGGPQPGGSRPDPAESPGRRMVTASILTAPHTPPAEGGSPAPAEEPAAPAEGGPAPAAPAGPAAPAEGGPAPAAPAGPAAPAEGGPSMPGPGTEHPPLPGPVAPAPGPTPSEPGPTPTPSAPAPAPSGPAPAAPPAPGGPTKAAPAAPAAPAKATPAGGASSGGTPAKAAPAKAAPAKAAAAGQQPAGATGAPDTGAGGALVSFKLRYVHQEELKKLDVVYDRADAVQRTYAPQGYFSLLAGELNDPRYFVEVDLDDPFFRSFPIDVRCRTDYDAIGLTSVNVALRYGRDSDPGGPKAVDFIFDRATPTEQRFEPAMNATLDTTFHYRIEYNFTGGSGWQGKDTTYVVEGDTEDRTLEVDPFRHLGFLDVAIGPGDIDARVVTASDVHLRYEGPDGWVRTDVIPVRPGQAPQHWRLRSSDREVRQFGYQVVHTLTDGSTVTSEPITTEASTVLIPDPFPGLLSIDFVPMWDAAAIRAVFVDVTYDDRALGYRRDERYELPGTQTASVRVPIALRDPEMRTFSCRATFVGTDNSSMQIAFTDRTDTLVELRPA